MITAINACDELKKLAMAVTCIGTMVGSTVYTISLVKDGVLGLPGAVACEIVAIVLINKMAQGLR